MSYKKPSSTIKIQRVKTPPPPIKISTITDQWWGREAQTAAPPPWGRAAEPVCCSPQGASRKLAAHLRKPSLKFGAIP